MRYAFDRFTYRMALPPIHPLRLTDSSQAHSIVVEDNWIVTPTKVNTLRYVFLHHDIANLPSNYNIGVQYLDFSFGQAANVPQYFPRTNHTLSDTFFINKCESRHQDAAWKSAKLFTSYFRITMSMGCSSSRRTPFNPSNPVATAPISFKSRPPATTTITPGLSVHLFRTIGACSPDFV